MNFLKMSNGFLILQAEPTINLSVGQIIAFSIGIIIVFAIIFFFLELSRTYRLGRATMGTIGNIVSGKAFGGNSVARNETIPRRRPNIFMIGFFLIIVAMFLSLVMGPQQASNTTNINGETLRKVRIENENQKKTLEIQQQSLLGEGAKIIQKNTEQNELTGTLKEELSKELNKKAPKPIQKKLVPTYSIICFESTDFNGLKATAKAFTKQYPDVNIYIYEGLHTNYILFGEYFRDDELNESLLKYRAQVNENAISVELKDLEDKYLYIVS